MRFVVLGLGKVIEVTMLLRVTTWAGSNMYM